MDFGKLDEHSKINNQGTGLGLSICKRMIEHMGGTVKVTSTVGVGTTFIIDVSTKSQRGENKENSVLMNKDSIRFEDLKEEDEEEE